LGYAASFCEVCRDLRPFRIDRLNVVRHINGIGLGNGETVGFTRLCQTCGWGSGVDPSQFTAMLPKPTESVKELIAATYPHADIAFAQHLSTADVIRRHPADIPAETRAILIRDCFFSIANQSAYLGAIQATPLMIWGIVAAFLMPICVLTVRLPDPISDPLGGLLFFGGVGCILWGVILDALERRKREPVALLIRALGPLKPTRDELAVALSNLTIRSLSVWKSQRPDKLLARMQAAKHADAARIGVNLSQDSA